MAKQTKVVKQEQTTPAPATVALRGGAAVAQVTLGAKVYRVTAKHNADWWGLINKACATGPANVTELVKAGVPTHFIGYGLRKGYLAVPATEPQAA